MDAISHLIASRLGKERAILAVVLCCAVLTYGGVSLFVVTFVVLPIAISLFRAADIPKRLIPGSIALGAFTFTMTALPGSPQVQNTIPSDSTWHGMICRSGPGHHSRHHDVLPRHDLA